MVRFTKSIYQIIHLYYQHLRSKHVNTITSTKLDVLSLQILKRNPIWFKMQNSSQCFLQFLQPFSFFSLSDWFPSWFHNMNPICYLHVLNRKSYYLKIYRNIHEFLSNYFRYNHHNPIEQILLMLFCKEANQGEKLNNFFIVKYLGRIWHQCYNLAQVGMCWKT